MIIVFSDKLGPLCFKHAVHEANKGEDVNSVAVSDNWNFKCRICNKELIPQ